MRLADAIQLLDSPISPFESGWIRHPDSRAHIAARSHIQAISLDTSRFEQAGVGAAIYARTGPLDRDLWVGHTLHLVYDTPDGCVMRSRFWLGEIDPAPTSISPQEMLTLVPDERVQGLHQHCSEEMSILASFLPMQFRLNNPGME